jgi:hypothetical protein
MACLFVVFLLVFPRIALILMFLLSNYLERAYHGLLIPLIGFLVLPLTTLVYAWMANTAQPGVGANLLINNCRGDRFGRTGRGRIPSAGQMVSFKLLARPRIAPHPFGKV